MLLARRTSLLVTLAATLASSALGAQSATARMSGVVRTTAGEGAPSARVTVASTATGTVARTVTGSDGRFVIAGLVPGSYTVTAALVGYRQSVRANVDVSGETSIDLTLEPVAMNAITVTATLREQELQDVPFAISAPTAAELRERGVQTIEDIALNQVGLSVQNLGPGQSQVAIRGASAGQIARDQPGVKEEVGVYLDDVPVSLSLFTPDIDLFDVSRVEVLRGPQGTLFGAGSLSGTVRYISNQPELGLSSVFTEVGASAVDGGTNGGIVKVGTNVPLGDRAAARVAAHYEYTPGFMDAVQPGLRVRKDVNTGDRSGVRASLRLQPSSRLTITPRIVYQGVNGNGWNRHDAWNILANPYTTSRPAIRLGERQLFTQMEEPYNDDFTVGDLSANWNLGATSLTSVTSYSARHISVVRDGGALFASIVGGNMGMPEPVYTLDAELTDVTDLRVLTQELRLAAEAGRARWLVGAFYSNSQRDYGQSVRAPGFEAATGIPTTGLRAGRDQLFYSDLGYDLNQIAIFGETTLGVTDRLDFTTGLRWYHFDEDRSQVFDGMFGNNKNGTALLSVPGSTKADGFAPRFIASFDVSSNLALNAQASKGFRLGGINDPLNVPLCTAQDLVTFGGRDSWKDETAWNYEVGGKSTFFGGRASLNLSAFYMDIRDLQLTVTAGSCSSRLIFNVPKARSQGVELEFSAKPEEHLDLAVNASFNDSKLRSTLTSTDAGGGVSIVSGIRSGNRLPSVPRAQGSVAATWRWRLASVMQPFVSGTVQHVGSRYTQIDDLAEGFGAVPLNAFPNQVGGPLTASVFAFDGKLPAYSLANARVGVSTGAWEVALFVNNLTNQIAYLALDRERGTLARVGYLTNQPRTVGVMMRFGR